SPRSASPIGPAPTRLPRMALPLPTKNSFGGHAPARGKSELRSPVDEQAEHDDGDDPHQRGDDRQPVQVALHHRRSAQGGGDAAAEQIGQTAALALVQQHQHQKEDAADHYENGQTEDHTLTRNSTPTRGNGRPWTPRPRTRRSAGPRARRRRGPGDTARFYRAPWRNADTAKKTSGEV